MTQQAHSSPRRRPGSWLRVIAAAAILAVVLYSAWQQQQQERGGQPQRLPKAGEATPPRQEIQDREVPAEAKTAPRVATTITHQQIRDSEGRVIYRGDVDLGPTLDRIESGRRLEYSHDGTVFQNRERRLPTHPAGYYHEYVHRTPGIAGPGPQRIVTGRAGEIYHTPDHYRTFQRLDEHE